MSRLLSVTLVFALAATAGAADAPKPNTLTPKEIADGWILLWDGKTTFGWLAPNESKWTIADGMLAPQAGKPGLLVTTSPFGEYRLEFEFQQKPDTNAMVQTGCDADGNTDPGYQDSRVVLANAFSSSWTTAEVVVGRGGRVQSVRYRSTGRVIEFALPSVGPGPKSLGARHIALTGNGIVFRNIKLKPENTQSLFNGKDLTGWKEYPGKKSKFSVAKEGTIHLESGPGDLQTESQWADFVLQLNCISHGDHCNSGVFFRCIPGEFENGYECQIRNEFTAEPKQEYALEEYDPTTHELKGTKKEKFTAVDYGTGGVYRRAPARKELSKDREWFGLTVVANGRHVATWVNGVQAVDWTDERPLADNPRKGCRLEKGAISLQGHEATDDLEFRDIRIQDLAPAEVKKDP